MNTASGRVHLVLISSSCAIISKRSTGTKRRPLHGCRRKLSEKRPRNTSKHSSSGRAMSSPEVRPKLSLVVVCYAMATQIKNTLQSLVPPYQRNISINEYKIILMENGSARMLDESTRKISPNLNYVYLSPGEASPSPAAAMNRGVALSRAPLLCLMIDGARLVTPGVLSWGLRLLGIVPRAIVEVRRSEERR